MACLAGAAAVLGGCVADSALSVAPGQGKSVADLQRDDAACRAALAAPTAANSTLTTASTNPAPAGNYYQCMAARGEMVIANRTVAYPVDYPYSPYAYGYPYAYPYGYPYAGYPYSAAYVAPYVGLGIGLGIGGGFYHDRGWHRGFYGGRSRGFYGGGRGFHR